jgi:aryl-alcohol dehydrogenase-like predicted oxidoreductase
MRQRRFGRLGWSVSEIGYGMWGMGGWTGSEDERSLAALDRSVALGCNFFDTAFAYGDGHSEQLLGETLKRHAGKKLYVATKVPPKNRVWPGKGTTPVTQVFPYDYIVEMTEKSRRNLGVSKIDLQQLHVWSDAWVEDDGWQRAARDLKANGVIEGFGISINRWEADNVLKALDTGIVDAVQVVYNVFDQAPEDKLFPVCRDKDIAVIARVPFDEGSLTGTLKADTTWPKGDWRNLYFTPAHIAETLPRVDALKALVPPGSSLPDLSLRFILHHPAVSTTIPGMRSLPHVDANIAASDAPPLDAALIKALRAHRWERTWQVP